MAGQFELEGAVLDVEVIVRAVGEVVEDARRSAVGEHVVGDDHVDR